MIDIVINNERKECPVAWGEVTFAQMKVLAGLAERTPESVLERFGKRRVMNPAGSSKLAGEGGGAGGTEPDGVNGEPGGAFGRFCAEVLSVMTGFSLEACLKTDFREVAGFVDRYLSPFIAALKTGSVDGPTGISSFEWKGERLELPRTGRDAVGAAMPCAEVPAEVFCDATALYVGNRFAYAALIVALLCRPAGEVFDQQRALERAGTMDGLGMTIVWEVFALLAGAHRYLRGEYPSFYAAGVPAVESGEVVTGCVEWGELPYLAAGCRPSELEAVRRMSGYGLVRLLAMKSAMRKKQLL